MSYFGSIYADMELPHRAKTVYMYLKDRSNAGNTCWPSVRTIAANLKLSRPFADARVASPWRTQKDSLYRRY